MLWNMVIDNHIVLTIAFLNIIPSEIWTFLNKVQNVQKWPFEYNLLGIGISKVVCLNSATAAEELNLRILGIQPGDEVIVPAYTYTATASANIHCGAKIRHICNVQDKKDTHNVESINADLRHYIPVLARKSRCFSRKIETLYAVIAVFVDAYNHFGSAKYKYRQRKKNGELPFSVIDFI